MLSPAEVALEDMQMKYDRLIEVVRQQPPDVKGLQLQLQGGIGTTVNQVNTKNMATNNCSELEVENVPLKKC